MAIRLWAARMDRPLTQQEQQMLLQILPPQRRARCLRLQNNDKQQQVLCAYALLRRALQEQYGHISLPDIALTDRGKPYFPAHPDICFSISHTHGAVLAGLSDAPIGVDIERIRPVSQRTMQRLAQTDSPEVFFHCWVRREAQGKCAGTGIGALLCPEAPLPPNAFYMEADTFPGYVAGVAGFGEPCSAPPLLYTVDTLV